MFVCLSSKAIHLELASDLTTEAILNACKRLTSRRGLRNTIMSDNATNFRGANNKPIAMSKLVSDTGLNYLVEHKIDWQFIPPRSPHMGGIWEAGIRSVKYHL